MADIRINSLPTTASASSSDDFLALDGATNGTRKLNAFSPTFGGNLTVSGVGNFAGGDGTIKIGATDFVQNGVSLNGEIGASSITGIFSKATTPDLFLAAKSGSVHRIRIGNVEKVQVADATTTISNNLTVSGTGTSTFSGAVGVQSTAAPFGSGVGQIYVREGATPTKRLFMGYDTTLDGGYIVSEQTGVANKSLYIQPGGGGTVMGGNLTVSGGQIAIAASASTPSVLITQTDSAGYSVVRLRNTGGTAQSYDFAVGGSGTGSLAQKFYIYDGTAGATRLAIAPTGNFLVGTTTDSGNGKLQLADHTSSTGGIGFGSDVALFRAGGNTLRLNLGVSAAALWFDNAGLGTGGARILGSSGALTVTSNGANSVYLQTGGTTALTLDSSLNATFAGNVTAVKAGTAFYSIESTVNGALSEVIVKGKNSTGTAREARLGLNKYADDVFSIYDGTTERFRLGLTNGDATFAGKVYVGSTKFEFVHNGSQGDIQTYSSTPLYINRQGNIINFGAGTLSMDPSAGNMTMNGGLMTGAPSGGTADRWKFGSRVAATTTLDTTQYLQVDIGGTLYKVALVTS